MKFEYSSERGSGPSPNPDPTLDPRMNKANHPEQKLKANHENTASRCKNYLVNIFQTRLSVMSLNVYQY